MATSTLLQVDDLQVSFLGETGWNPAVQQVSFTLEPGKTLGFVGESGSGKSVTSLALMNLLPQRQARIQAAQLLFDGRSLQQLSGSAWSQLRGADMAMIFQEPMTSLNPVYSCGYQVAEAIRAHGHIGRKAARERVLQLFSKVQLPRVKEMYNAYPHQLSGGQKQRVMIAMAISCNPSLLIADEPTTALDVTVQRGILDLLKDLQSETGMGMLFISHDLAVVAAMADHIAVMQKGWVVEQGTAEAIMRNPQHPYTQSLLACRPPHDVRLKRLPVVSEFLAGKWPGGEAQVRKELSLSAAEREAGHQEMYAQAPLLSVNNLKVWFPIKKTLFSRSAPMVKAVDGVSFQVYPGETVGLVGESGCGKTSLGRALLRLNEPEDGEIDFEGNKLILLPDRQMRAFRKHIQIVFQDPYSSLNPRMSVGEAIKEPMTVHRLHGNESGRRQKVLELLQQVGLDAAHYHRYPHEFSGGQRQRICIARALAVEPRLIVCDESVSALDVSVQAQVLNLLNSLKKALGLTFIFISHDLAVVRFMSDRILVMKDGKIEETGEADSLYHLPQKPYTKKLIAAIPGGYNV
ncbi:MAG: ABC transporter ATP-binding protein [Bacteroidetes bacterium]|nr:ABC transporter ATP-binding protein [Bacteroidota bacterium]